MEPDGASLVELKATKHYACVTSGSRNPDPVTEDPPPPGAGFVTQQEALKGQANKAS